MPILRTTVPQVLQRGLDEITLNKYPLMKAAVGRFLVQKSTDDGVFKSRLLWGAGLPQPIAENEEITFGTIHQEPEYEIAVQTVGGGLEVGMTMLQDAKYRIILDAVDELTNLMAYKRAQDAAAPWNNGFNSAYTGRDGQPLFSDSHPISFASGGATTFSNVAATPSAISSASLTAAYINLMTQVNGQNLMIDANAEFFLKTSVNQRFVAKTVLGSTQLPGSANNDINPIGNEDIVLEIDRFQTSTTAWVLGIRGRHSVIWLNRMDPWRVKGGNFATQNSQYGILSRHSTGHTDWRGVTGNAGA